MSSKQVALKDYVDLKTLAIEGEITSIQNDILTIQDDIVSLSGEVQILEQEVDNKVDILSGNATSLTINDHIDFTPIAGITSIPQGQLIYNADEHCLSFGVENGSLELGKEVVETFTNLAGVTLVDGDVVSVIGVSGNRQAVALTDPKNSQNASACIGMVTEGAAPNGLVRVTKIGRVHNLNTNAFTEGLPVYVDPLNPGKLTQTPPSAPNVFINVGVVEVKNTNVGVIGVDLRVSPRMQDLSDVNGTPLSADGQIPIWHPSLSAFDFDKNINDYALNTSLSNYATQTFVTSSISEHNIDGSAHQDIRNLIPSIIGLATETFVTNSISEHNLDISAHQDIRNELTNVSNSLSSYVPYSGSNQNVDIGVNTFLADKIMIDTDSDTGEPLQVHGNGGLRLKGGSSETFGQINALTDGGTPIPLVLQGVNANVLIGTTSDIGSNGGAKLQVRSSTNITPDYWSGRIVAGGDLS